jgi:hypothetical protein
MRHKCYFLSPEAGGCHTADVGFLGAGLLGVFVLGWDSYPRSVGCVFKALKTWNGWSHAVVLVLVLRQKLVKCVAVSAAKMLKNVTSMNIDVTCVRLLIPHRASNQQPWNPCAPD